MVAGIVYLDGEFLEADRAKVSIFDRGFLFGHAAYEVTAVYDGALIDWPGHAARLMRTLHGLEIAMTLSPERLQAMQTELLARNSCREGLVYLNVSAGAYGGRDFAGPDHLVAKVMAFVTAKGLIGAPARDGISAISRPDTRWMRRDLKTTQLLSQALAYRAAREADAVTAWMHEDGMVTEAASANAWIVTAQGELVTRALSVHILAGITRAAVLEGAADAGASVSERTFSLSEVAGAREAFTTSAGALIVPVVRFDGQAIGDGRPGPVTRRIQRRYYERIGADVARAAPWALG